MPIGRYEGMDDNKVKISGQEFEITENAAKFAGRIREGSLVFYKENNGRVFFIKKLVRKRVNQ